MRISCFCGLALLISTVAVLAQQPAQKQGTEASDKLPAARQLTDYVLGPNDEIVVIAVDAEEISNKPMRIGVGGDINLPMAGRIRAAGMTVQQLETEIAERLKVYVRQPQVSVNVTQFKSQPVTVLGSVRSPGVIQLEGRKTLVEVLSMAGGTLAEASSKITITRRKDSGPLPVASASGTDNSPYVVGEVDMRSIIDASRPEQNIQILPNDVITVPRAPIVYAVGQVNKPGGFTLNEKDSVSVLQLVAMAGGTVPAANTKGAKVIRPVPGSTRIELAINLKDIMSGKAKDIILKPEDILYVPDSYAKGTLRRTADLAISITTGMAIYRGY
jgi:polysaccharide export outer membrane protein